MKRVSWIVGTALIVVAASLPALADAPTSAPRVEAALGDLHRFVGEGENGQRWKAFLHSSELAEEVAKGGAADQAKVESILSRYSGNEPGLDMPQFVAVRSALSAWHRELSQAQGENLGQLARDAAGQFRPASQDDIEQARRELRAAMATLDAFVKNSPDDEEAVWRTYLRWDELTAQAQRPEGADPQVVEPILSQFSAYENGLTLSQFVGVRRAF